MLCVIGAQGYYDHIRHIVFPCCLPHHVNVPVNIFQCIELRIVKVVKSNCITMPGGIADSRPGHEHLQLLRPGIRAVTV